MIDYSTNNTYLKLTRESTVKAVARAKQVRPRVSAVDVAARVYSVRGSRGDAYTVSLAAANGRLLARCSCPAGERAVMCYHIPYAVAVACGIKAMRRGAR